jgi:hypothetical protein
MSDNKQPAEHVLLTPEQEPNTVPVEPSETETTRPDRLSRNKFRSWRSRLPAKRKNVWAMIVLLILMFLALQFFIARM